MTESKYTYLHLAIEFTPAVIYGLSVALCDSYGDFWTHGIIISMVYMWKWLCMPILYKLGLINLIFGMEFLVG